MIFTQLGQRELPWASLLRSHQLSQGEPGFIPPACRHLTQIMNIICLVLIDGERHVQKLTQFSKVLNIFFYFQQVGELPEIRGKDEYQTEFLRDSCPHVNMPVEAYWSLQTVTELNHDLF